VDNQQPTVEAPNVQTTKDVVTVDPKYSLKLQAISEQLDDEFKAAIRSARPWRERMRTFQKLYINQRKNPKKVGDTLMFSSHQTIVAALTRTS
jgi:hypothetical protein